MTAPALLNEPACGCLAFRGDEPELARLGLGAAVLRYQQRMGYAVLGLAPGTKPPHRLFKPPPGHEGEGGVHWATTDPRMTYYVWSREKLAGIGIATGAASRLLVVDLDIHGITDGRLIWQAFLAANNLSCPWSPWTITPRGGWHLWFRLPEGVNVPRRIGILSGVDILGEDSYVVAPPTMILAEGMDRPGEHGGGGVFLPYRWASGCPCTLPMAPDWMIGWAQQAPQTAAEAVRGNGRPAPRLEELERTGLPVGERNVELHRLACSLYRKHGTGPAGTAEVRAALARVAAASDMTGFGESELSGALASARRFVAGQAARERQAWEAAQGMIR